MKTKNHLVEKIALIAFVLIIALRVSAEEASSTEESIMLDEVEVIAHKPIVKQYADRIEVTVSGDILNAGSTALDALQRAPGVTVDKQGGNVKLMGKEVIILIDGRDSKIPVSDLLAMLESMPAENLATLDLMTTPPAQYEAEGKGGVINIKIKKAEDEGLNGSLSSSLGYGKYWKYREGVNLYYSEKKIALYGGINFNNVKSFERTEGSNEIDGKSFLLDASRTNKSPTLSYRAGMDYYINKKNSAGFVVDGYSNINPSYAGSTESKIYNNNRLDSLLINEYDLKQKQGNIHTNLYYEYKINENSNLKLDGDYLYSKDDSKNDYTGISYNNKSEYLGNWSLSNPVLAETDVLAFRLNYSSPIGKIGLLDAGVRSSFVSIDYASSYHLTQNWNSRSQNSVLDYAEQNYAMYTSLSGKIAKKMDYKVGLRGEYTRTKANTESVENLIDSSYVELFPSAFLMYPVTEKHVLKMSYNKRISRPHYNALNPFQYYVSQLVQAEGTPTLMPSITHNVELGHIYNNFLFSNLFYMHNKKDISQIARQSQETENAMIYFFENIGTSNEWGFFTGGYKQIKGWWGVYANVTIYYTQADYLITGKEEHKENFRISSSVSSQFFLPRHLKLELSGYYQSPEIAGAYKLQSFYIVNFNAAKSFGKKQEWVISLKADDIFNTKKFTAKGYSDGVYINLTNTFDSRQIWLSATWKFGQGKSKSAEKENIIQEEQNRMGKGY